MLGPQTEFDPDLVVVRMDQIGGAKFTEPPLPSYWIVNPDPPQPELTAFELRDGRYALAAETSGSFAADRPFAVTVAPAGLTRGLRR
jgi:hypothetical protein